MALLGQGSNTMPFELESYLKLRPMVWHLTHRENLSNIRKSGALLPATELFSPPFVRPRRGETVGKFGARIRNQDLLNERSVELECGTFQAFIKDLNRRVFFWSGRQAGPVRPGRKAMARYLTTDVV